MLSNDVITIREHFSDLWCKIYFLQQFVAVRKKKMNFVFELNESGHTQPTYWNENILCWPNSEPIPRHDSLMTPCL